MAKLTDVRDTPEIANGAKVIAVPVKGGTTIYQGVFVFDNTATAANKITAAHVLKPCYMEDDHTVTALATGASVAGTVIRVDDEGVAVECGGYIPAAAAASVGG